LLPKNDGNNGNKRVVNPPFYCSFVYFAIADFYLVKGKEAHNDGFDSLKVSIN
jgi:hypothetical protein